MSPPVVAGPQSPGATTVPPTPGSAPVPPVEVVGLDDVAVVDATDVLVLAVDPGDPHPEVAPVPGDAGRAVARLVAGIDLDRRLRRVRATGAAGQVTVVELERDRPAAILLVGVGDRSTTAMRRAGAAVSRTLATRHDEAADGALTRRLGILLGARVAPEPAAAFTDGLLLAAYRWRWREVPAPPPVRATVAVPLRAAPRVAPAVAATRRWAQATWLARDLANTPSNVKDPAWLAEQAERIGRANGLDVTVWGQQRLRREGFGGLLAVGSGSASGPALVRLDHRPPGTRRAAPVVLVGKGITFDSGGLSIKPAEAMTSMKTDMSGAGAVLGVMSALVDLDVRRPVTALLALAENLPGATAYRPGDVIVHHGGRTTEVMNTDAEGRLVLADAMAYAVRACRPSAMVDVATLTGAATLALGRGRGAVLGTSDRLVRSLVAAGDAVGEQVWPLPLVDDYAEALASPVADACHITRDRRLGAGAITAALFLRPFAGEVPWAHLDIAGPARSDADRNELSRGGTGFAVRLLLAWLSGAR